MNLPEYDLYHSLYPSQSASQSGSDHLKMDNFDFDMDNFESFETGAFLDQNLEPMYTSGPQNTGSIRPSDLVANAFHETDVFGPSQPSGRALQIDPSLTESRNSLDQRMHTQLMTPSTSRSPERFGAVRSRHSTSSIATARRKSSSLKTDSAETDDGDADAERRSKNRVAASKCRIKKKGREQMLIQESDEKEQQNLELKAEHKRLTQEALWFKNQLIMHGNCGDPSLNRWLANSAAKIVHKLGEAPDFQRSTSQTSARSSAEPGLERRDSGFSIKSKSSSKVGSASSPITGQSRSLKIGLGSPVDGAMSQDVNISPVQLQSQLDGDLRSGRSISRTESLTKPMDALGVAAGKRTVSVPTREFDVPQGVDGIYGDGVPQDSAMQGQGSAVPLCAFTWPTDKGMDSTVAVPWDAQLSPTALTIDPRLRGGDMSLDPINADLEPFASPTREGEQNHDELLQIHETQWMDS